MTLAHEKHGYKVVYKWQPFVRLIPTSIIADSSACKHKHWSRLLLSFELQRSHPFLKHDVSPHAVPLYPVEITLF